MDYAIRILRAKVETNTIYMKYISDSDDKINEYIELNNQLLAAIKFLNEGKGGELV